MDGWIKLHRQIIKSSKFADPDILRLWILCLTKASHKGGTVLIEKQEIQLTPGQFVTGRFALQQDYNEQLAPRNKVKDTTLWSWLKRLEQWGDIDIKSTNKFSVISILKWSEYQETLTTESQQNDNRLTAESQQTDTNKNVKNVDNAKNERKKELKKEYADYVFLTETEYGKLTELLGDDERDNYFLRYASWISGRPKKEQNSRSAYLSILNWHRENEKKSIPFPTNRQQPSKYEQKKNKLDQMLAEAEAKQNGTSGYYQTGTDLFG